MLDTFDTMFPSKPPMTAAEARDIVAEMQRETPENARRKLWATAIRIGNLSEEARDVYRAALAEVAG